MQPSRPFFILRSWLADRIDRHKLTLTSMYRAQMSDSDLRKS